MLAKQAITEEASKILSQIKTYHYHFRKQKECSASHMCINVYKASISASFRLPNQVIKVKVLRSGACHVPEHKFTVRDRNDHQASQESRKTYQELEVCMSHGSGPSKSVTL